MAKVPPVSAKAWEGYTSPKRLRALQSTALAQEHPVPPDRPRGNPPTETRTRLEVGRVAESKTFERAPGCTQKRGNVD